MTRYDESLIDDLIGHVASAMEALPDSKEDERLLAWLARDLRRSLPSGARERDERDAVAFAQRAIARFAVLRTERALPRRELRLRSAPVVATVAQSQALASGERCATLLDLAVAAGAGREIWDEPCDRWLELPEDIGSGGYVALRVAGDSMSPILESRDVILIKLDASPRIDDLIVARLPDHGDVVKRVASINDRSIELASFNAQYEPVFLARDSHAVVGTVIARFTRE